MSDDSTQWYYTVGTEQKGPVSGAQMRSLIGSGSVTRDTLVWTSTLTEWQPMGRTALASMAAPAAPMSPMTPATQQQWSPPGPAGYAPQGGGYAAPGGYAPQGYAPVGPYPGIAYPGLIDAVKICFSKYVTWSGRASRSEYWWFALGYVIVAMIAAAIDGAIIASGNSFAIFTALVVIAFILPSLSVMVRRLHDTDHSGWAYWMALIPLAGPIILLVFLCSAGTPGPNRFG